MLEFTPELWTLSLPHRTQIIYAADIAMIVARLQLVPGKIVVESGTGSGSLTTSLARAVGPLGHVYTFEFNLDRVSKAREEFVRHGLDRTVTVTHADACADGFAPVAPVNGVDGVFLDLPSSWKALPHAYKVLKKGGVLCNFNPCIEQVQRSCVLMREMGFESIVTLETLIRPYELTGRPLLSSSLDPGIAPKVAINTATAVLPASTSAGNDAANDVSGTKRRRSIDQLQLSGSADSVTAVVESGPICAQFPSSLGAASATYLPLHPVAETRGHTGYLTFATLYKKKWTPPPGDSLAGVGGIRDASAVSNTVDTT
jgi:tRNA A58 N-methylase Trm61